MLAPVVIFVYSRLDHTVKTIESLKENFLANETDVIIFSDAAKSEKSETAVKLVREYIDTVEEKEYFKSVKIFKAPTNVGLANSVISGVEKIINLYGKVIVVEDDLISSKDFLQFMNAALKYYQSNKEIWSISGYTFDINIPSNYKNEVYLSYRGSSWGWATWKNRWDKVDWDVKDYKDFNNSKTKRNHFNKGGRDLSIMLDAQMNKEIDSWAIRWCYTQSKLNMFTVYPKVSRIKNIGLDGTGTHSGISSDYNNTLNTNYDDCKFSNPGLNKKILKSFKNKFGTRRYFIIGKFKKNIKNYYTNMKKVKK